MHYVISFETRLFDLDKEDENPINPIKGKSVGEWMANLLKNDGIEVTEVDAEDWGWYSYATCQGSKYLVGFIGLPSESKDETPEIMIQIDKSRSFFESISGKNKMTEKDPLLLKVQGYINGIHDVASVKVLKNEYQGISTRTQITLALHLRLINATLVRTKTINCNKAQHRVSNESRCLK